jgi:TolB protein
MTLDNFKARADRRRNVVSIPRPRGAAVASALVVALLAACSGGDPEPKKKSAPDVPAGTVVFRRFLDDAHSQAALFTIATDGTGERQITHPPDYAVDSLPDWSPDGGRIAFHREFTDKPYEIYTVSADGSDEQQVEPGCPPTSPGDQVCEETGPSWSPDGKTIAFSWAHGEPRQAGGNEYVEARGIAVMADDGSDAKLITQTNGPASAEDAVPIWSPDGTKIAFMRRNITAKPLDGTAIFVANADGTRQRRITPWELNADDAAWSPDGALISFRSEPTGADFIGEIHTVHPDGSGLTQLTHANGKQVLATSFSPDGDWIVFAMTGIDEQPDLYVMRRDGSDLTPLTRTPGWDSAPAWKPR